MEIEERVTRPLDLFLKIIWLLYIGISCIVWIVVPFLLDLSVVDAFYTREGDASYIYKVLAYIWSESRIIGSAMTKEQIASILPQYNGTCIFTYIAARFGISVSIFCSVLLVIVIIVSIIRFRKNKSTAGHIIVCILVQALMMVFALILQNWQFMPFVFYFFR